MPLLITIFGIFLLILLIAWVKADTFLSFLLVSVMVGWWSGMGSDAIVHAVETGIGNTLGSLVIILGLGAMLGRLVADSGAARQITDQLISWFGLRNIRWGLALAGLIIGIPMFYTAGFVVVVPFIFAIAHRVRLPLLYIAIPMLSALSVAHGFLPPHPSPTAIAVELHANIGKTLLYGIVIAIPVIALAGPLFATRLKKYKPVIEAHMFTSPALAADKLPGVATSFIIALMPLILLTLYTIGAMLFPTSGFLMQVLHFIGNADIAMFISVIIAIVGLGLKRGLSMKSITRDLQDAFQQVSVVMFVIAGAGAFMQVLHDGGLNDYLSAIFVQWHVHPLLMGWLVAAVIRICIGSATVAGLTTVGILMPFLQQSHVSPELMVLSIGAGSLMFSHVNDGGFWLFKEYFHLTMKQTFLTWSVMETIVSIGGLAGVWILHLLHI
ncbi:gluconate:H+ symporter [Thermoflavifilum thermophilum]|uniref:Gnt-I system high-affinity gluconate transporter n=1 Tax=Thermoflavifilum thermophilum TaxID=1393122 RepID=A0A1I7N851_9BACT|nr:gluconate:H+ symporter [Thermoflavifilum thermophilum]SFV30831.1 Gnt-I system high-affinity gluconate transporter [Thermoflavifilum thermophilum]